ncbi:hypothetical protein LJB78_00840 [Bacteroidales bacterium OttesenSCG-928-J16]|nr:hypothetical protein [Bacteroidales bacterium OttesenSCG-928-J16]
MQKKVKIAKGTSCKIVKMAEKPFETEKIRGEKLKFNSVFFEIDAKKRGRNNAPLFQLIVMNEKK